MATFSAAIASILVLTALGWLVRRASRWPLCPVCLGVSGTWLWLLGARLAGLAVDPVVLAMLLGASVVGAAQWVEARLPARRSPLLWKALAVPAGLVAAYGLVAERWGMAALGAAALALLVALFLRTLRTAVDPAVVAELEERMKKCC